MKKLIIIIFLHLLIFFSYANEIPYVILISFDGFRWDYLNRGLTPKINEFVKNGVQALSLRPSFPTKTLPNHYSIVTGLEPESHGLILNSFKNPATGEWYNYKDSTSYPNAKWYGGEAIWTTLQKKGIRSASYFWVGSEMNVHYRRPAYYYKYKHDTPYKDRIKKAIEWLNMSEEKRPHFITLYFHEPDEVAHHYSTKSTQLDSVIMLLDNLFGQILEGITKTEVAEKINIILVSDHGMKVKYL